MKTVLNIKIEKTLKDTARDVATNLGLSMSTVVNNYLRQFIDERQITFREPLVPNKKTAALLRRAEKDIKAGKNLSPVFANAKDMDAYLRKIA
ncbi:MAG: type II toxin-antitoxin system RelB/DinJ family antitoxin [Candidatus Paceibacterota bacterium]|jgi:addiction module RelB/DinJ family antitoxin